MSWRQQCLAAAAAFAFGFGCVDYTVSQQEYCKSVTPSTRARVCEDGPKPTVLDPLNRAINVSPNAKVTATFDQAVYCSDAGLIVAFNSDAGTLAGLTECSGTKAIFTPSAPFVGGGRSYKATITEDIRNDAGTPALPSVWTFQVQ